MSAADVVAAEQKIGYLTKRALKSGRNWKRRFFVLDTQKKVLTYAATEDARKTKGELQLTPDSQVKLSDLRQFCFTVCTPTKQLFACANSNLEVCSWVSAIQKTISSEARARAMQAEQQAATRVAVEDALHNRDAEHRSALWAKEEEHRQAIDDALQEQAREYEEKLRNALSMHSSGHSSSSSGSLSRAPGTGAILGPIDGNDDDCHGSEGTVPAQVPVEKTVTRAPAAVMHNGVDAGGGGNAVLRNAAREAEIVSLACAELRVQLLDERRRAVAEAVEQAEEESRARASLDAAALAHANEQIEVLHRKLREAQQRGDAREQAGAAGAMQQLETTLAAVRAAQQRELADACTAVAAAKDAERVAREHIIEQAHTEELQAVIKAVTSGLVAGVTAVGAPDSTSTMEIAEALAATDSKSESLAQLDALRAEHKAQWEAAIVQHKQDTELAIAAARAQQKEELDAQHAQALVQAREAAEMAAAAKSDAAVKAAEARVEVEVAKAAAAIKAAETRAGAGAAQIAVDVVCTQMSHQHEHADETVTCQELTERARIEELEAKLKSATTNASEQERMLGIAREQARKQVHQHRLDKEASRVEAEERETRHAAELALVRNELAILQAATQEGSEGSNNEIAELRAALKDAEAKSGALQQQQDEAVEQLVASKMEIASQALELEKLRGQLRALQVPLPGATDEGSSGGKASPPTARRRRSQSHPAPVQPSTSVTTPSPSMAAAAVAAATVSQAKTMWGRLRRGDT
eukprot:g1330.t1